MSQTRRIKANPSRQHLLVCSWDRAERSQGVPGVVLANLRNSQGEEMHSNRQIDSCPRASFGGGHHKHREPIEQQHAFSRGRRVRFSKSRMFTEDTILPRKTTRGQAQKGDIMLRISQQRSLRESRMLCA